MTRATSPPIARWVALAMFSAAIVFTAIGIVLQAAVDTFSARPLPRELALAGLSGAVLTFSIVGLVILTFSIVGLVIVSRYPRHPIAWLLLALGFSWCLRQLLFGYAAYGILAHLDAGAAPAVAYLIWQGTHTTDLVFLTWLLLLFPAGRPASSRWGLVGGTATLAGSYLFVRGLVYPGPLDDFESVINPIGVAALGDLLDVSEGPTFLLLFLCLLGAAGSLLVRLQRSSGAERQQLKWFAYAGFFLMLSLGFLILGRGREVTEFLAVFGIVASSAAGALAIGIAILRYRLYDIDILINRTVVYGATSAAIAATFWVGLVALQPLLRPFTSGSEVAVAASTLVSFALFQSVRRRVQDAVDRRFDRSRYDAARTLDVFADRLRDEVDLDALRDDLLGAVRQTMSPAHSSLWLRRK